MSLEVKNIKISILIPTYNRPKYFSLCLESALSQEGFQSSDLEYIISDDSEGEETQDLVQTYKNKNPNKKITYIKNPERLGMVGNWNSLLKQADGDFYIFLSDDDLFYSKDSLSILYSKLYHSSKNAIFGLRKIINGSGNIIGSFQQQKGSTQVFDISINKLMVLNQGGFGGVLFRNFKDDFFDTNIGMATDWDFNIAYTNRHGGYCFINEFTFLYRVHEGRLSEDTKKMSQSEKNTILKWRKSHIHYYIFVLRKTLSRNLYGPIIHFLTKLGVYNFIRKYI